MHLEWNRRFTGLKRGKYDIYKHPLDFRTTDQRLLVYSYLRVQTAENKVSPFGSPSHFLHNYYLISLHSINNLSSSSSSSNASVVFTRKTQMRA